MKRRGFLSSLVLAPLGLLGLGRKRESLPVVEMMPPLKGRKLTIKVFDEHGSVEAHIKFGSVENLEGCFIGFTESAENAEEVLDVR